MSDFSPEKKEFGNQGEAWQIEQRNYRLKYQNEHGKLGLGALEADWKVRRKREEEERLRLEAEEQKKQQKEQAEKKERTDYYINYAKQDYYDELKIFDAKKSEISTEYKENLDKLANLAAGENYIDSKTGSEIPRENKKKMIFFTQDEKDEEYKDRIKKDLEKKYNKSLSRADDALEYKKGKKEAYERMQTAGTLELNQIKDNYSEQQRRATKEALMDMAKGYKKFIALDDPLYELFNDFYTDIESYYREKGEEDLLIKGDKSKTLFSLKKYHEIDLFKSMRKKLANIKEQSPTLYAFDSEKYLDAVTMIEAFEKTFSSMADGYLKVPHDAQVTQVGNIVYDKYENIVDTEDFSDAPLFAHDPTVHDAIQGHVGDCYLVSSLGALASADPTTIKNSMKDNGSTVTVRLYKPTLTENGIKKVPIYFEVPKRDLGINGGLNALWVNCMEYAYNGYRVDKMSRKRAIHDLLGRVNNEKKAGINQELDRLKDEFYKYAEKYYGTASDKSEDEFYDWFIIEHIEVYLREQNLYNLYKKLVDQELKGFNDGEVHTKTIESGTVSEVMSVFTGDLHYTLRNRGDKHGKKNADDKRKTDLDKMNDLAFVFNDLMGTYFDYNPIKSEKGTLKSKTCELKLDEILKKKNEIASALDNVSNEGKKLNDIFKEYKETHPNANAKNDPEYAKQQNKLQPLQNRLNELKKEKLRLDKDYEKTMQIKKISADEEDIAKQFVAMYLTRYDCSKENYASATSMYKAYMTRPQMRNLIKKAKANFNPTSLVQEMLSDPTGLSIYTNIFKETDMDKIEAHKNAIADACAIYFDAFVQHAEDNTVLNYERFSGKYSKTAERTFDLINNAIEHHCPVTATTFEMSADNADIDEETGEHTFDGITSKHEYIVLGTKIEYEGDKAIAYVRVRNPWGYSYTDYEKDSQGNRHIVQRNDSYTDGISEIELNDFMARFDFVSSSRIAVKGNEEDKNSSGIPIEGRVSRSRRE